MSGLRGCAGKGKIKLTVQVQDLKTDKKFFTNVFVKCHLLWDKSGYGETVIVDKVTKKYLNRRRLIDVLRITPTIRRA